MFEDAQLRNGWLDSLSTILKKKKLSRLIAGCLCFALSLCSFYLCWSFYNALGTIFESEHTRMVVKIGLLLTILSTVLLVRGGSYLVRTWERYNEVSAEEALANDPRPPILYLRPFRADSLEYFNIKSSQRLQELSKWGTLGLLGLAAGLIRKKRAEESLVDLLDGFGPVIAIGRPGEKIPPLGAARFYVGDDWKTRVSALLQRSKLVVMVAGLTPHFFWEVGETFRNRPFVPTLLILPFFSSYKQSKVDRFVQAFANETGLILPLNLTAVRLAYFPNRDTVIPIYSAAFRSHELLNQKNPFLGSLIQVMDLQRPGWGVEYIRLAEREQDAQNQWKTVLAWVILAIVAIKLLLRILN